MEHRVGPRLLRGVSANCTQSDRRCPRRFATQYNCWFFMIPHKILAYRCGCVHNQYIEASGASEGIYGMQTNNKLRPIIINMDTLQANDYFGCGDAREGIKRGWSAAIMEIAERDGVDLTLASPFGGNPVLTIEGFNRHEEIHPYGTPEGIWWKKASVEAENRNREQGTMWKA